MQNFMDEGVERSSVLRYPTPHGSFHARASPAALGVHWWGLKFPALPRHPPDPPADQYHGIERNATEKPIKPGATPRPQLRCVKNEGQSDMAADPKAKGEDDPFPDQRHRSSPIAASKGCTLSAGGVTLDCCLGRLDLGGRNEAGKIISDKIQGLFPTIRPSPFFASLHRKLVLEI